MSKAMAAMMAAGAAVLAFALAECGGGASLALMLVGVSGALGAGALAVFFWRA